MRIHHNESSLFYLSNSSKGFWCFATTECVPSKVSKEWDKFIIHFFFFCHKLQTLKCAKNPFWKFFFMIKKKHWLQKTFLKSLFHKRKQICAGTASLNLLRQIRSNGLSELYNRDGLAAPYFHSVCYANWLLALIILRSGINILV